MWWSASAEDPGMGPSDSTLALLLVQDSFVVFS